MLEICTHKFLFLKRKEFWFYNSEKINKGMYNVFCYSIEKNAIKKRNLLTEQTSLIALEEPLEELFRRVNRTFKYHINKAEHIGIITKTDYTPTLQKCEQIMDEFSVFANKKNIAWNPKRLKALQKTNALIISEALWQEQRIVTHVYLHDTHRVVLLHSYHHQNFSNGSLRGYANKLLHWKDILNFKTSGLKLYDFGGINLQQHPGISKFKLSYGGNLIDTYSYTEVSPLLASAIEFYKRAGK